MSAADKGATWGLWLWFFYSDSAVTKAKVGGRFWKRPVVLSFAEAV